MVMPVFNAADYLEEAILSIAAQSYPNLELIIVDDFSTDGSFELANDIAAKHSNISVYKNGKHRGVSGAANLALKQAKGKFIARMDADDIAHKSRIAKQVSYLLENPDAVAVGTQCDIIDQNGKKVGEKIFPLHFSKIKEMMFYSIPLQQPTLMVNTNNLPKSFKWYDENYRSAEEVELLFRLFEHGSVGNLPETLHQYRIHGKNISLKNPKETFYLTFKTRLSAIRKYNYRPTAVGIGVTLSQLVVVSLLPSRYIYPVYRVLRGMKKQSTLTINKVVGFNLL